jgi:hypothetical protein
MHFTFASFVSLFSDLANDQLRSLYGLEAKEFDIYVPKFRRNMLTPSAGKICSLGDIYKPFAKPLRVSSQ